MKKKQLLESGCENRFTKHCKVLEHGTHLRSLGPYTSSLRPNPGLTDCEQCLYDQLQSFMRSVPDL